MANLEVKQITKTFDGKTILNAISFTIKNGQMLGLVGASGCGKSTTLKVIAGLVMPDSGSVWIDGEDMTQISMEDRNTVIVFQDFLLFPHMTVKENIAFGLKVRRQDQKKIKEQVARLIELVHLEGNENKYPRDLSGGQKQRVAIARALAVQPKVLLLDEPFSSLDIRLRGEMREFIKEIHEKTDTTIILVTHDKEEAFDLCDQVGIMMDGKLMQLGEPREIYQKPHTKAVAEFFGQVNYVKGIVKGNKVMTLFGEERVFDLEDKSYEWLVRPEGIYLDEQGIEASVKSVKFLGDRMLYELQIDDQLFLMQTDGRVELRENEMIKVKCYLDYIIKS